MQDSAHVAKHEPSEMNVSEQNCSVLCWRTPGPITTAGYPQSSANRSNVIGKLTTVPALSGSCVVVLLVCRVQARWLATAASMHEAPFLTRERLRCLGWRSVQYCSHQGANSYCNTATSDLSGIKSSQIVEREERRGEKAQDFLRTESIPRHSRQWKNGI